MSEGLLLIYLIARREFLVRIRSRFFQVGTLILVVLLAGYIVLQGTVLKKAFSTTRMGFVGSTQALAAPLRTSVEATGQRLTVVDLASEQDGEAQIRSDRLDAVVGGSPADPTVTVRDSLDPTVEAVFNALLRQAALNQALVDGGLDPRSIGQRVAAAGVHVDALDPGASERNGRIVESVFVAILLYTSLLMYGQFVAQGVIEEKANRIVEILLSAVPARSLLFGKVAGIGLVGLLQLTIIGLASLVVVSATQTLSIPPLSPAIVVWSLAWFLLGFAFYALLFAAAASLVSRQEDVASATGPITVLVVGTYLAFYWVIAHPDNGLAVLLSVLPGFAPIIMPSRIATGDAQLWQELLAVLLSGAAIFLLNSAAARIYTYSVVRLGGRVSLREAWAGR